MIYLIDDKRLRQIQFGWTPEKFEKYSNIIKPLYNIEEVANLGDVIYSGKNIILYHESFLDFTTDKNKALKQREKLLSKTKVNPELSVAFFSGSQGSRSLVKNQAFLHVSILYQNLEILLDEHLNGSQNLNYLLFGNNPKIETELSSKLIDANREIENDAASVKGLTFFIHPDEDYIQNPIQNAVLKEIYFEDDDELNKFILRTLDEKVFENIFIPLCFGKHFQTTMDLD